MWIMYLSCLTRWIFSIKLQQEYCWWFGPKDLTIFFQKRVSHTFPSPIDRWALEKAQKALKRVWKKSPMFLPVDKIHSLLKEVLHNHRLDDQVSLYIAAVLQFIAADILNVRKTFLSAWNSVSNFWLRSHLRKWSIDTNISSTVFV